MSALNPAALESVVEALTAVCADLDTHFTVFASSKAAAKAALALARQPVPVSSGEEDAATIKEALRFCSPIPRKDNAEAALYRMSERQRVLEAELRLARAASQPASEETHTVRRPAPPACKHCGQPKENHSGERCKTLVATTFEPAMRSFPTIYKEDGLP
jgi:hypothetical protein